MLISELADPFPPVTEAGRVAALPAGPWIVVVGMHRSGTSVVTGLLGGLGLALPRPADRWEPMASNPEHFESASMVDFDDRLLELLEGSWHCPPEVSPGWEERPEIRALDDQARHVASRAFPEPGPVVWKDPRVSLLLPFWRRVLPAPLAGVLIWRSPEEVAGSLRARDKVTTGLGMALWEHYNRAALAVLEGSPAYVASYDDLTRDPSLLGRGLASWLDSLEWLEPPGGAWDVAHAADVVDGHLRHQRFEPDSLRLASQDELAQRLAALGGSHRSLPPAELGPRSPWSADLLEEHRQALRVRSLEQACRSVEDSSRRVREANARLEETQAELIATNDRLEARATDAVRHADRAMRTLRAMRSSTSWRITKPLRAIARISHRRGAR